jgi:NitT/TauT family transport system substrate-binding protein
MRPRSRLIAAAATVWLTAGLVTAPQAEPLRISYTIWVGFGPLFVAQERGFFAAEGVDVHLINIEHGSSVGTAALLDGQIDALSTSADTAVARIQPDRELFVWVAAFAESAGGDGVVATRDIRSIADLKGKTVAFQERSVPQFYLNVLLKEAGLSEADIEPVLLPARDAADAFMLREVDAAVTWEPWLTLAKDAGHGHLLTDSSDRPGLIADGLFTTAGKLKDRRAEFKAVARAWAAAVAFVEAHREEAIGIMARGVGGGLEDPAVFAETLKGVRYYDGARNKAYFGTPERPGQAYETVQHAIDVWSGLGMLDTDVSPADLIAQGIWDDWPD